MRIRIIILSISLLSFLPSCGQKRVLGIATNHVSTDPPSTPVLFIISGESNSTGYADNSEAASPELAERNLKILNNDTYTFQGLDIGANNILNATGEPPYNCPSCTTHGMELQLANSYDSGYYSPHPCYLIKAGHGGSTISQWNNGGAYYDSLVNRIDRAVDLIRTERGIDPIIIWIYSQGINDMLNGTSSATWKTATKNLLNDIRDEVDAIMGYPVLVPIIITRFDGMDPNDLAYETVIGDIDSEVTECYAISTSADLKDAHHWNYAGHKDNVRTMKTLIQSLIAL